MIKQFHVFIILLFILMGPLRAQENIEVKLISQEETQQRFSFETLHDSYQVLELSIEINAITHSNRNTFISIFCIQDNEELEIGRFFLPQSNNENDLGVTQELASPYTYDFDLCLWQKVLINRSEIILKTNGSFKENDIQLHVLGLAGVPSIKVKEIIPLWNSDLNGFDYGKDGISKEHIPIRKVDYNSKHDHAFIQVLVHGIAKNQNPSARFYFLNVNNQEIAKRSIWRDDCAYNPFYPQSQNWHQSRPNWCPGLRIYPLKHQVPSHLLNQNELNIDLRFQKDLMENSGVYAYVVSAVMFVLEEAEKKVNVAITEVLAPNVDKWHKRYNPICGSPVLIIKNLGAEPLNQVTFNYGYNFQTDNKYRWKGELGFLEEEIVYLPPLNWYFFEKDDEPESFTAIISSANGEEEAFPRGKITTEMELAEVYPYRLTFHLRTDKNAIDNALEIFDDNGNPYFLSGELVADSNYYFHVNFIPGCYELILFDQMGDGIIDRNKKLPVLEILDQRKGTELKTFDGDFGGEIREQFMIFR